MLGLQKSVSVTNRFLTDLVCFKEFITSLKQTKEIYYGFPWNNVKI